MNTAPVYTDTSVGTGTVTNPDRPGIVALSGEYTTFTVNPLVTLTRLEAAFSNKTARCPANWAIFINNSGNKTNLTNAEISANCLGNGSSAAPNWDLANWVDCPNAVTFP